MDVRIPETPPPPLSANLLTPPPPLSADVFYEQPLTLIVAFFNIAKTLKNCYNIWQMTTLDMVQLCSARFDKKRKIVRYCKIIASANEC